jgi:hypothetical protein
MRVFLNRSFFMSLALILDAHSMQAVRESSLRDELVMRQKEFALPAIPMEARRIKEEKAVAIYGSELSVIANIPYELLKERFCALSMEEQKIILSHVRSLLAECSELLSMTPDSADDDMTRTTEPVVDPEEREIICLDSREASEFVMAVWTGVKASYDWEAFLGSSPAEAVSLTIEKLDNVLTRGGEYIDLIKLDSPGRRLLMALYSLNLLKNSERESDARLNAISAIESLERSQDCLGLFQSVNPYHRYLSDIDITGLTFRNYGRFFNYDTLVKLSISLHIARGLFGSGVSADGSIGQLTDNLREFVNYFSAYNLRKKDCDLFTRFMNLKKEFTDL